MDQLHLITVNETTEQRLQADGAELTVCISGQSFFTGTEAFKKAVEVNSCVEGIKRCGISQDDISIQNVSMESVSGMLSKSSSATYYLSVISNALNNLGPTLSVIAAQKNSRLTKLRWIYDDLAKTQNELLQTAVKQAKATGQSIADALDTRCSALHKLNYNFHGANQHQLFDELSDYDSDHLGIKRKRASYSNAVEQLNLEHITKLRVEITAQFVVAPFLSAD